MRITSTGGPEVLELVDVAIPQPGPDEVLIKSCAIGVGMPDILVRKGVYAWMPRLPSIIGIEMAGVIEGVGSGVRDLSVGQTVYVNARDLPERSGAYAEYRVAPAQAVHRLHPGADLHKAAALGNYQVAECLLRMGSAFPAARSVAVFGAAGGVGSAAVQLAAARGWRVIAVAGSEEKCRFAQQQGAHEVINHANEDVVNALRDRTGGAGADLLLDLVAGDRLPDLFGALSPLGVVVSYGFLAGEPSASTVPAMRRRFGHSPGWRLFSMHSLDAQAPLRREVTLSVLRSFADGLINPPLHRLFGLQDAQAAHQMFERHSHMGKLVLLP